MTKQRDFFGIHLPKGIYNGPARQGWTRWQKGSSEFRRWWSVAREANWLKRNVTEYFDAAGELVAEERWGINGEAWRMRKPAKGQQPRPLNYAAAEAALQSMRAKRLAEVELRTNPEQTATQIATKQSST